MTTKKKATALKIISKHGVENCVFWVGAGISFLSPTNLPLGWDLTEFAIQKTCGEKVQKEIFDIWKSANQIATTNSDNPTPLGAIPRLETILGEINDVQNKLINDDFDFMQGFSSFQKAPYNLNHLYIANLLKQGATVITTNFDIGIQRAYSKLSHQNEQLISKIENDVHMYSSSKNAYAGKIWHLHGTSADVSSLGTTVRKVKEGIPASFQQYLNKIIKEGKLFVFLGYSASDSFDVNIYFQNKLSFSNSYGIFIQHGNVKPPRNALLLKNAFRNFFIENHDTTTFLEAISDNKVIPSKGTFDWKEIFIAHTVPDKKQVTQHFITCKIVNALGININKIEPSAYEKALQVEKYYQRTDFHKTLAIVQRTKGNSAREKKHDITVKTKETDLLGYYYAQGHYKKAITYAKSIKQIFFDAENLSAKLDWGTYTSMGAHCRPLITQHLKSPFAKPFKKDIKKIKTLIELTKLLGNRPLYEVQFINQPATALRFNFLLNAMIGNNILDSEKTVLHLYGEGASVVGFVSTFRDIAIKYYFLAKHTRNRLFFEKAQTYANKSHELANLIGEHSGIKRAKKLQGVFKIISIMYR